MKPSYITLTEGDLREDLFKGCKVECPLCDVTFLVGDHVAVIHQRGRYVGPPVYLHVGCLKKAAREAPKPVSERTYRKVRERLIRGATPLAVYVDEIPQG